MGWTQAFSERILHIWKTEISRKNENVLHKNENILSKKEILMSALSRLNQDMFWWWRCFCCCWVFSLWWVFKHFLSFSCTFKKIFTKKLNSFSEEKIKSHKIYEVSNLLDSWLHDNEYLPYFSFFNWCWKHWHGRRIMHMITATVGILLALQMRTMAYHREATECLKAPTVAACLNLLCSRICFLKSTIYIFLLEGRLHIFLLKNNNKKK